MAKPGEIGRFCLALPEHYPYLERKKRRGQSVCVRTPRLGKSGLQCLRENQEFTNSVPQGRPSVAQDVSPISVNLTGLCLPSVSFMFVAMKSVPSSGVEFENWEILSAFLPEGWSEQARQLGAMQRARYIKEPSVVLRILLMHVASGCSLAETAARAQVSGLAQVSSVGVFKRQACGRTVVWLAGAPNAQFGRVAGDDHRAAVTSGGCNLRCMNLGVRAPIGRFTMR